MVLQSERHIGYMSMIESIMASALVHLERLNDRRRETVPASELVVGVQCGGSDAFSGVTANPAVGWMTDEIVRHGGTSVLAETTETYGAEHLLTRRAVSRDVGEKLVALMNGYLVQALTLQKPFTSIGIGAWLGTIMWANVWFVIWPNQKKALGIVTVEAAEKAAAAKRAGMASRINTMLSIPMLYFMVAQSHGGIAF